MEDDPLVVASPEETVWIIWIFRWFAINLKRFANIRIDKQQSIQWYVPMSDWFRRVNLLTVVLCFLLVVIGAYVRLSNAGLSCPSWPGCYGQVVVPSQPGQVARDDLRYPDRPVRPAKAWKEMIHRYLAGIVSLLVLLMAVMAIVAARSRRSGIPLVLPLVILGIILVQVIFGALTVIWEVEPIIVTTHLMLGFATLALLWWMWLLQFAPEPTVDGLPHGVEIWSAIGLAVLTVQIFLGGWTSTNYAGVACPNLPTCLGSWFPPFDYGKAFALWHPLGLNYEGGILSEKARATIHMTHRYGAAVVTLILGSLGLRLIFGSGRALWQMLGWLLLLTLLLQVAIGISMIEWHFPLWLTDAHTGGAALLMLSVVTLNHYFWSARRRLKLT